MNNLKKKVYASAAMLLVAAVMLTGSSFAWYTISTHGDVDNMKVKMTSTDNLEIARATDKSATATPSDIIAAGDTGNEFKWGTTVNQWDYTKAELEAATKPAQGTNTIPTLAVPATATASEIVTLEYAADGRAKKDYATASEGVMSNGVAAYTADIDGTGGMSAKNCAVAYAVWIRSNNDLSDVKMTVTNSGNAVTASPVVYSIDKTGATPTLKKDTLNADGTFNLKANEPKLVEVVAYVDGVNIFAEDVNSPFTDADGNEVVVNGDVSVDFTSETITNKAAGNPSQH